MGEKTIEERIEAAKDEIYAEEQYRLGLRYLGEERQSEALSCLLKAAQKGHGEAQYHAGTFYAEGNGVERSESKALDWFEKALTNGSKNVCGAMKRLYLEDNANTQYLDRAIEILSQFASQENAGVSETLAELCLKSGHTEEAAKYYALAAKGGSASAHYVLGSNYASGCGSLKLKVDIIQALSHYTMSAGYGCKRAHEELGNLCFEPRYDYMVYQLAAYHYEQALQWAEEELQPGEERFETMKRLLKKLIKCYKGGYSLNRDNAKVRAFKKRLRGLKK